jgi:4-amino-4-deoxy-L-arabinose transferase-like glycosyltransferase
VNAAVAREPGETRGGPVRGARWILFGLLAALALLTLAAIPRLDPTADERVYWIAGRNIVATGQWEHVLSRLQGPLPLAASQLGSAFVAAQTSDDAAIDAARYGMAPLVVLAGWLVYRLGRRLFGERGGLSALALFVLHPLLYGYGALMAVDMTHCVTTLIAWLATGWACERPSARRVLVAGAALALPLATKYLACLVVPGLGLVFAVQAYRRTDPRWPTSRRAGRAALLLLLLAATALLALHGCYGFLAGLAPAEPAAYRSDFFRTVIGWPVLGDLLRWLPAPMLLGADFQMDVGETVRQPFLDGEFRAGHPDYYLRTFAYKTPDALLLLTALGLPLALGRWAREPGAQRVRVHLALAAASLLPLWLYTSLGSTLQIGIRYVLPTVPILLVFLGGAAAQISWRGPWRRTALALGLASLVFDLARSFPDGISYVNHFAGGPRSAVLHFVDSNADWGQWANSGPRRLRDRYPEIQILERADGPRLGLVAVRLEHKNQPDPLPWSITCTAPGGCTRPRRRASRRRWRAMRASERSLPWRCAPPGDCARRSGPSPP